MEIEGLLYRLCGLMVRVPGYRSRSPKFDSRLYQISREVVGLERGSLSVVSAIEELVARKYSSSGIESREYGRVDSLRSPRAFSFYLEKFICIYVIYL
jgi:hypothetical protein